MVLKFLKKEVRKYQLFFFGNHISLSINLKFFIYNSLLKIYKYLFPKKQLNLNLKKFKDFLNNKGFIVLDSSDTSFSLNEVDSDAKYFFDNKLETDHSIENNGLIRLKNSCQNINNLLDIFKNPVIDNLLKQYFQSEYYVYSSDVYRTVPIESNQKAFDSTQWHFDNSPTSMLKLFVYLSDVDKFNGPLTLANKKISKKLKKRGLFLREDLMSHNSEIENNMQLIIGKAGTVILFTPENIHKATLPKIGHRDVAVFLIYPSFKKQKISSSVEKIKISQNFGYMTDPFFKKPLRKVIY